MRIPLNTVRVEADRAGEGRSCGTCTACCVLPRIAPEPDFPQGKAGYVPCGHLCQKDKDTGPPEFTGCSIHDRRPELCRAYSCMWRLGIVAGDERRRPDRLGLMLVAEEIDGQIVAEAWELWDGAASEGPGRWFLDAVRTRFPVAVRFYGVPASTVITRPEQLADGRRLSALSLTDPRAVARWAEAKMADGSLEMPEDAGQLATILADMDNYRRGVPVPRYYSKGEDR